jgi:biopolymer transport protein TolR
MGFSTSDSSNSRRGRFQPMSEINVTPFVDVMLVLLIVFMVTAPLLTVGVPADLPKTEAASLNDKVEPLVITIAKDGGIYIQETPVDDSTLIPRLQAITQNNLETQLYIRGDQSLTYGKIMELMGHISAAGFSKVTLLAEIPDQSGASSAKGKVRS